MEIRKSARKMEIEMLEVGSVSRKSGKGGGPMTKRATLLGLCVMALLVGVSYVLVSHPSGIASMVVIGLPFVLAACSWRIGER